MGDVTSTAVVELEVVDSTVPLEQAAANSARTTTNGISFLIACILPGVYRATRWRCALCAVGRWLLASLVDGPSVAVPQGQLICGFRTPGSGLVRPHLEMAVQERCE